MDAERWLHGIDHGLEGADSFFRCLPVLTDGERWIRVLSYQWTADRGVVEERDGDSCQPLELADRVAVPEGHLVLVMGPGFAVQLARLGVGIEGDWRPVQEGFRAAVVAPEEAERRAQSYAALAHRALTDELGEALRDRQRPAGPLKEGFLTPVARAAHTVLMSTACCDRHELALLDVVAGDLVGDGGATYSRRLALHATRLKVDVEWLRKEVEARINHLVRACARRPSVGPAIAPRPEAAESRPPMALVRAAGVVPERTKNPFAV